jgi:hypothetical protein
VTTLWFHTVNAVAAGLWFLVAHRVLAGWLAAR